MNKKGDLVIASNNKGKIEEIKNILSPHFDRILSLKEAGAIIDVEESGDTFFENALLKAQAGFAATGFAVLSDDSGIEVDALEGAPGVYSARFAGEGASDSQNRQKLLALMRDKTNRSARFKACMVLMFSYDNYISAEGACEGSILMQEEGENGFGYDCIFYSNDLKQSFGLAPESEKNKISHRARALAALMQKL